mgnify:CR=1 FL=1
MRIILDAMGGDNAPQAPVIGALQAAKDFGAQIILVGRGEEILSVMRSQGYNDLPEGIEIAHADPYVPSMPLAKVVKEELPDNIRRRIFIFERASQFDLLSMNPETFMWVSPVPQRMLERYHLVQRKCADNKKIYKDVLIYKNGYKLSKLDRQFITELCEAKRKHL